ncbi:hypothetical protein Tco_1337106 [Tanacetum coccineum]
MKLHCSQGLAFPAPTKNRPRENCNPRGIERKASSTTGEAKNEGSSFLLARMIREKLKRERAKQKGKTEGKEILAIKWQSWETFWKDSIPRAFQSLKHERDRIDRRLKKGVKG